MDQVISYNAGANKWAERIHDLYLPFGWLTSVLAQRLILILAYRVTFKYGCSKSPKCIHFLQQLGCKKVNLSVYLESQEIG